MFEPVWPLVHESELWIAMAGPSSWGGAHVHWSEDDDEYFPFGSVSAGSVWGALLDPLPALDDGCHLRQLDSRFRVLLHGNVELPAASVESALGMRSKAYVGSGNDYEVLGYTMTRFVEQTDDGVVYECSGFLHRGLYGTGRTAPHSDAVRAHVAGEQFAKLDKKLLRMPFEDRLVGTDLYLKFQSYNAVADPDSTDELVDVEPIVVAIEGKYLRDPRRLMGVAA